MYLNKAMIFNIQRYSIHDGPGIRTTVFCKGCPLRCLWCSNPESLSKSIELAHNSTLCNMCGKCVEVCPRKAISVSDQTVMVDRQACDSCGKCIEVCYAGALKFYGQEITIQQVMDEVLKDGVFYRNSSGGITASGGEALMQADFVHQLFKQCKQKGLHTCLDTSGYAPWSDMNKVLEYTDLVYYDLKHMDSAVHKKLCGVSNDLILSNLASTASRGIDIVVRIPLIPGVNDSEENLRSTAEFVYHLQKGESIEIDILPYHQLGLGKYVNLDRKYPMDGVQSLKPDSPTVIKAKEIIESTGLKCRVEI